MVCHRFLYNFVANDHVQKTGYPKSINFSSHKIMCIAVLHQLTGKTETAG